MHPPFLSHLQVRQQRRQLVALRPLGALQLGDARLQRVGVALQETRQRANMQVLRPATLRSLATHDHSKGSALPWKRRVCKDVPAQISWSFRCRSVLLASTPCTAQHAQQATACTAAPCLDGDADGAGEAPLAPHLALAQPHAARVEPVAAAVARNHGCTMRSKHIQV